MRSLSAWKPQSWQDQALLNAHPGIDRPAGLGYHKSTHRSLNPLERAS